MSKNKSNGRGRKAVVVLSVLAVLLCAAIIILNIFIPVRYLSAYLVPREETEEGQLKLKFVDVGFGDCAFAVLPDGRTMLIDGGNGDYENMLAVLSAINACGADRIDYLVCTSVKEEHCGGLAEVLKYKQVGTAYIPYCANTRITEEYHSFINALAESGAQLRTAQAGEGVVGDGYFFSFLSPVNSASPTGEYALLNSDATAENIERASAVLWLEYGENAFLFTSDARRETLERITREYEQCKELSQPFCAVGGNAVVLEKCDLVTVPAHGGRNNTYAPFYDLITPRDGVVSVGENFAGYPDMSALSDIYAYAQPYYTRYDGTITVTADKTDYTIEKEIK